MERSRKAPDLIEELERIERFIDGDEPGERPIDVLRERGVQIPAETSLDDDALHARLWAVIAAMADLGMYVEDTDHLSDRELYRYLVTSALIEETVLSGSPAGAWVMSPIGGCSNADTDIYLRFYADEEERESFREDYGRPFPPKETAPFDRDRLLPKWDPATAEER